MIRQVLFLRQELLRSNLNHCMRIREKWILVVWVGLLASTFLQAQVGEKMTRDEYVSTYSELAMREMIRTGIPASIKLAQACLESNNGNSRLALRANNHFGIKCHDWEGKRIYQDDDERRECFRSYPSAYDSYMDHSDFLSGRSRYASLFDLPPDDYKRWAHGLKQAGYATAPNYAALLIRIIEELELFRFDRMVMSGSFDSLVDSSLPEGHSSGGPREVRTNNGIEYVIVQPGDTPESLRNRLDLYPNEIFRYNDLPKGASLVPGDIIYLQPKRRKAARGNEIHVVQEGESMRDISQSYGVRMKNLYLMNQMDEGREPRPGDQLNLRRKKHEPFLKLEPSDPDPPEEEMRFIFEE
jgi:hypothetical protein